MSELNKLERVKQQLINGYKRTYTGFHRRWRPFADNYPRLSWWVKWTGITIGSGISLLLLFLLIISLSVPSVRQLRSVRNQIASDIYTSDSLLLGRYYNEYRTVVGYEEIPQHIFNALVATEDERFFSHSGIDYRSWARVLVRTVLRGDEGGGGGSTISQQLAKNLFPRRDYWLFSLLVNKLREIITARRLERAYDKIELLTFYLNTVPFPENIYGIDVAARRFFGKPPIELTPEEGAILIGTLRATSYYDPVRFPERSVNRRNVVLSQMQKNDYLSQEMLDSLTALPLTLHYNPGVNNEGIAPYFRSFVRQEVDRILTSYKKPNGDPYNLYTDGLRVYTTLQSGMQRLAEEAVKEHMSDLQARFDEHWRNRTAPWTDVETVRRALRSSQRYQLLEKRGLSEEKIEEIFRQPVQMKVFSWQGDKEVTMSPLDSIRYHLGILQLGFLVMEPESGYIRAWVGGADFDYVQYDHVRARRQAGSVFKPIIYARAIRDSIDPCEQILSRLLVYHEYARGDWGIKDPRRDDPEPHFDPDGTDLDDWIPQNADGKYGSTYSLEGALTNSVNTVTVELIMRTGVEPVVELARAMGISGEIPMEPSIALGTAEVPLYEMILPFATLANQGRRVDPLPISRIETHEGELLVDFSQDTTRQVLKTETAAIITQMLRSVTTYGTASRLRWKYGLYNIPIAGKTGTSQNHSDGWFIGYTPKLVAGAWVGGDSPLVRFRNFENGQGAASALPIWALFMRKLHKEPALKSWQNGEFTPLSYEQRQRLNCPMRIPSPEEILADSLAKDSLLRLELMNLLTPLPLGLDSLGRGRE